MGLRIILFLSILVIILAATLIHIGCEEEEGSDGADPIGACCRVNGKCTMESKIAACAVSHGRLHRDQTCSSIVCDNAGDDDSSDDDSSGDDDSSSTDDWYKYWNCIDDCKDDCGACCSSCGLDWSGNGWCEVPGGYTGTCDDKCADDYQDCFDWCKDMYG